MATRADEYPSRRVTIIVPHAAGGGVDLVARLLAAEFQEKFGQPFAVENKVGGGTLIGATAAATAKPDGYTLLVSTVTTLAINPSIYKQMPYDPAKDFEPITSLAGAPFVLAVNPSVRANNIQELIALAKSQPRPIELRLCRARHCTSFVCRTFQESRWRSNQTRSL